MSTDVTKNHDRISFKTQDIEGVWESLQQNGCSISDLELQRKSLLDRLFETTTEVE